jgi:hypothetical protein
MAGTVAHQLTIRGSKDNNVVIGKDKEETTVLFSVTPEAPARLTGQSTQNPPQMGDSPGQDEEGYMLAREVALKFSCQRLHKLLPSEGDKDALCIKPPYNIKVDIKSLRHLPQMDTLGKCDSYVIVRCGDQEQRTKKKKNNLDPDFKETFEFKVTDSLQSLIVNVMDWEMSGRDEEVGSNQIQVGNLMAGTVAHQLTIRGSKDNNVVIGKDKEETTVLFSVTPEAIRRGQSHF